MGPGVRHFAGISAALSLVLAPFLFAGCGGGGSGSGTTGNTVNVSLASAVPNAALPAAGATFDTPAAAIPAADNIDHVWITIRRVALIPGNGPSGPDPNGETAIEDSGSFDTPGQVSADITPPVEVDLLHLPAEQVALFLNAIDNVPAGTYGKIRLYYTDPKVHFINATDNTAVHRTANFHLDIHFVGGGLVVPVSTGGGVRFFDVSIVFVLGKDGLKITVNPNNILMRPQVFATVSSVRFAVTGTADNVDKTARTFDIATAGGRSIPAVYDDNTAWSFNDNATSRSVPVSHALGVAALDNGAIVFVIGPFSAGGVLLADDVTITFPFVLPGTVVSGTPANGWRADNTFVLNLSSDNVVFPRPSRAGARYDNVVDLSPLADSAIVFGATVTARGYAVSGGIDAYWISVGP